MRDVRDLVGYRVLGREGELGVVVDEVDVYDAYETSTIAIRGGVSDALLYRIPAALLVRVSRETRTAAVDVDVAAFVPNLREDGTIELNLRS